MILYYNIYYVNKKQLEDAQWVIRNCKWKDRQQNCQTKKEKIIIYKTLHRKLKMEYHYPHKNRGVLNMSSKNAKI